MWINVIIALNLCNYEAFPNVKQIKKTDIPQKERKLNAKTCKRCPINQDHLKSVILITKMEHKKKRNKYTPLPLLENVLFLISG